MNKGTQHRERSEDAQATEIYMFQHGLLHNENSILASNRQWMIFMRASSNPPWGCMQATLMKGPSSWMLETLHLMNMAKRMQIAANVRIC